MPSAPTPATPPCTAAPAGAREGGRRSSGRGGRGQRRTRRWSGRTLVGRAAAGRGGRTRRPPRRRRARAGPVRRRSPGRRRPRRRLRGVIVREPSICGPNASWSIMASRMAGRSARCRNQASRSAGSSAGLADEQRLDEGHRVRGVIEPLELRDAAVEVGERPRAPPERVGGSPDRPPAAGRPRGRCGGVDLSRHRLAGLSSIAPSGCPDAGVSTGAAPSRRRHGRGRRGRRILPACAARRTSSDRRPRSGRPRAAANVESV